MYLFNNKYIYIYKLIMKTLQIAQPNTSRIFHSPICKERKRYLIRTGTLGDGSCFFHALLFSLHNSYRQMPMDKKLQFVAQERKRITDLIQIDQWKTLGDGEIYRLNMIVGLRNVFEKPYGETYMDTILTEVSNQWKSLDLKDLLDIFQTFKEPEDLQKIQTIQIKQLESIELHFFKSFKQHLLRGWVDEFLIELIQKTYKCGIHILHYQTREPYMKSTLDTPYNKHVIILWINDHYESMGLYNSQTNKCVRVFDSDNDIIKEINSYYPKNE